MRRRLLAAAVVAMTIAAVGVSTAATAATRSGLKLGASTVHQVNVVHSMKSRSGRLARTDRSLLHRTGSKLIPVVVKLDYDAVASYAGGLRGLPATSPRVTGRKLSANRSAVAAYQRYIAAYEGRVRSGIAARIPRARVVHSFRMAYGGLSLLVPANQVAGLLQVSGVAAVQQDRLAKLLDDTQTLNFLGAPLVWPGLGGQDNAGQGVLVANLDTGVWPENPMFADNGRPAPPGGPYACQFGDGSDPDLGAPFTCNNKLVGAYAFTDTYLQVIGAEPGENCDQATLTCSARDSDGHGTHTLSTAAGDRVNSAPLFGIERGPVSGIAPGAPVIAYRVCLEAGCFQSDSVAAINQAIDDGVDVLNFSISGGASPFTDPVELAFLDFYASGGLANASAGNSGPGAGTSDHGGAWTNTIGASYGPNNYLTTLHLQAGNGDTFNATGSSITPGVASATPVKFVTSVAGYTGNDTCNVPLPANSATGTIIICKRGNPAGRNPSAYNVLQGNGAGMIIYNPTHQDLFTDNFWVPTVMLDSGTFRGVVQPGAAFVTFMNTHSGVTATFATGTSTAVTPDIMTTFSSRGPVGFWIKPNVTAPGIQILAGHAAQHVNIVGGPNGELYQAIAGTSMSAPHATGVAALVKAVHPTWTPGQVMSALMTSSVQDTLKEDGVTPTTPFDSGSGGIRANRAASPTLTFDVPASDYYASANDPLHRVDLNLPSIDATTMPGTLTTHRTAVNVSSTDRSFHTTTVAPAGASITVTPSTFGIDSGQSRTLTITINGENLAPGQYFGKITLTSTGGATPVVIPVAFVKTQGVVTLSHTCAASSIAKGTTTSCQVTAQNLSPSAANAHLTVTSSDATKVAVQNVSAPGVSDGASGFHWDGTLSGAVAPTIDSITPGGSPAGGYLPLSLFGIPPIGGVGDETIVNFNVPSFKYGSETYTRVGIDSNGYVVIGGGTSQDNDCCNPQTFPNPARPNNVIGPFWTDLNPGAGGAERIGTLTDGTNTWIVVDWEGVPTFGTSDTQEFQIWLQIGATENVTYAYGNLTGSGAATGLTSGAENRDGTSGVNQAPVANTDFTVNTSPPTPGGSVHITYNAFGKKAGSATLAARLTSDQTPGTTTVVVPITVTP